MAIQPFATIALSSVASSDWIRVDEHQWPFEVHALVDIVGTSATYDVEFAIDDLAETTSSVTAYTVTDMSALTVDTFKKIVAPITGLRLNVSAVSSATVTLKVRQSKVKD